MCHRHGILTVSRLCHWVIDKEGPIVILPPTGVAMPIRDVNASNEAMEDQCLDAYQAADIATRSAWTTELRANPEPGTAWLPRVDWSSLDVSAGDGSSFVSPNGHLCGLFAVDIAGFNASCRDDDIQIYVHESLYAMLQKAFDRSDVPWLSCVHEDRGDGVLVIVPPMFPVAGLVDPIPEWLRRLVRRHNHVSCEAAQIQLRVAAHIGPVHYDGHGFVGRDVNLLCRLLDARSLKRMLTQSGAEVAFITSGYVYENVVRRRPSLVHPPLFQSLSVRVKETRTRAWAYVLGALPESEAGPGKPGPRLLHAYS
jgi:hypothetical protein